MPKGLMEWTWYGLLLFALLYPSLASADLTREQAASLYAIAYGQVGFLPEDSPTIYLMPAEELDELVCKKPCGAKAAQVEANIYLLDTLDMTNPMNASILLHELVHFVQWKQHGPAKDCDDYHDREVEAYKIQFDALARLGIRPPSVSVPMCI
jgi:hypothetical protein